MPWGTFLAGTESGSLHRGCLRPAATDWSGARPACPSDPPAVQQGCCLSRLPICPRHSTLSSQRVQARQGSPGPGPACRAGNGESRPQGAAGTVPVERGVRPARAVGAPPGCGRDPASPLLHPDQALPKCRLGGAPLAGGGCTSAWGPPAPKLPPRARSPGSAKSPPANPSTSTQSLHPQPSGRGESAEGPGELLGCP